MMRSESTSALGQPSETKLTFAARSGSMGSGRLIGVRANGRGAEMQARPWDRAGPCDGIADETCRAARPLTSLRHDTRRSSAMGNYSLTISARRNRDSIAQFLHENFFHVPLDRIDSIFGFSQGCRLYGGRRFSRPELSSDDISWMYTKNIGYRIPLSNMIVTQVDYESEKAFLERHHRKGNSVIVVKDGLAQSIRRDFPLY